MDSNDLAIYRQAGEAILRGKMPYRDFFIEYPPGSLPAFVPPALLSDDAAGYAGLFSSEMALVLVGTLALTALAARRTRGSWIVAAVTFTAATIMLYPVATTRFDAVVALALAIAVFCTTLGGRYVPLAYASLGLGAAAKLVPALATMPLALTRGRAVRGLAIFSGVVALFFVPALLLGGARFMASFAYQAERGLQVESFAASILMMLGGVSGLVFRYGAFEVLGQDVELASSLSPLVTGALLLVTAFFLYREYRSGGPEPETFPRYAAALILAVMLGSKVLSPQYMIWLLPLVPLSARGMAQVGVSVLLVAVCWTTTLVFPIHYDDLLNLRPPGPGLLLTRNELLAALWVLLLFLPVSARESEAP